MARYAKRRERTEGLFIRCDAGLRRRFRVFCASKDLPYDRALGALLDIAESHERRRYGDIAVTKG